MRHRFAYNCYVKRPPAIKLTGAGEGNATSTFLPLAEQATLLYTPDKNHDLDRCTDHRSPLRDSALQVKTDS